MNAATQRTPGPWAVGVGSHLGADRHIFAAKGRAVTFCPSCLDATLDESRANAEFIVEACNNYERVCAERDELAKALHELLDSNASDIEEGKRGYSIGSPRHAMWKRARAALAKVTP